MSLSLCVYIYIYIYFFDRRSPGRRPPGGCIDKYYHNSIYKYIYLYIDFLYIIRYLYGT